MNTDLGWSYRHMRWEPNISSKEDLHPRVNSIFGTWYKAFFGEGDTRIVNEFASNDKELTNKNFLDSPAEF